MRGTGVKGGNRRGNIEELGEQKRKRWEMKGKIRENRVELRGKRG